jgi:Flp pilus assembly protein TadG
MEQIAMKQNKAVVGLPLQGVGRSKIAESGQTLIEFALMLPFLLLLLLGIVELGRAAFITITITNAATAGAEYGSQNAADASDFIGMQNKALCDANGEATGGFSCNPGILTSANTVATNGCACDTGSGTSCNQSFVSCTDPTITGCGGQIVECVKVTTHADFSPLLTYPAGLPTTYQANGKAIMRVRK